MSPPSSLLQNEVGKAHHHHDPPLPKPVQRKPGGWRSMPYILGNESFERLASIGLVANFTVFLMTVFHMNQVSASNLINIWYGINNFLPLIGAFISDAYVGKFWVIAFSSFATLLGMVTMTLIVALPKLHPPSCARQQSLLNQCEGATTRQFGFLVLALGFLSVGTGGIRPCSLPFGVDQFDPTTDEGRKDIDSFFNCIFSGMAQTLVAAYKKRNLQVEKAMLYDPPMTKGTYQFQKLPLTNRFRCLNKAAIILDGETNPDGSRVSSWNLASIQQVEEVKCLIKVIPILVSGVICYTALVQQWTFTVSQALKMDRHLGQHFQIPAGSIGVISMITIGIWLPIYDRILVPSLRKITKIESGITLLQRIGIGIVFSILAMIAAAMVEKKRRDSATSHNRPDGVAPLSVMWLAPQLILMAFAEVFNLLGLLEFYYKEFPDNMKSMSTAMFCVMAGVGNYLSSALVTTVHKVTGKHGRPNWLAADINAGRVDYFYYVIAGLGVLNMGYHLIVSSQYQYKEKIQSSEEESKLDIELNALKK
ncbi:putative proton-dependent oligopeptide transporter family, MFS transporter superfamily [Helianthus annuus]|nr:putative proton-dependent oligopeptide transporter family, MFS transporter superfamily [Helianthus annuus]KAJ0631879.1 putative proton-dependent oligopeptide transporter family, MFS transporter superfamily [Helianthus annuus]KAJ0825652.1 putative proton-dependent oligopeptide transporter family, MFS transporter superfamily [Helianthus annuus]